MSPFLSNAATANTWKYVEGDEDDVFLVAVVDVDDVSFLHESFGLIELRSLPADYPSLGSDGDTSLHTLFVHIYVVGVSSLHLRLLASGHDLPCPSFI